jgi:hypothetical protein
VGIASRLKLHKTDKSKYDSSSCLRVQSPSITNGKHARWRTLILHRRLAWLDFCTSGKTGSGRHLHVTLLFLDPSPFCRWIDCITWVW